MTFRSAAFHSSVLRPVPAQAHGVVRRAKLHHIHPGNGADLLNVVHGRFLLNHETQHDVVQPGDMLGLCDTIEVFFKTSKSVLRLTGECRSLSYDAMCAQCAIVFARYMFLAVGIRENQNLRSAGPLFCLVADELADISFAEALEKLQLFLEELLQGFHHLQQGTYALIVEFLADLPADVAKFLDLDGLKADFDAKTGCEL